MILRFITIISLAAQWLHCHSKDRCLWILTAAPCKILSSYDVSLD